MKSENLSSVRRQVITRSGMLIDPLALKPGDVLLEDIIHSLAHECRWRGVLGFRSVAWHSYAVSWLLSEQSVDVQMLGLLHDMAEVFIGDIATPMKKGALPESELIEDMIFGAMWLALGLPSRALCAANWVHVKRADADVGAYEYQQLATPEMKRTWVPTYGFDGGKGAWPEGVRFNEPATIGVLMLDFELRFEFLRARMGSI